MPVEKLLEVLVGRDHASGSTELPGCFHQFQGQFQSLFRGKIFGEFIEVFVLYA